MTSSAFYYFLSINKHILKIAKSFIIITRSGSYCVHLLITSNE